MPLFRTRFYDRITATRKVLFPQNDLLDLMPITLPRAVATASGAGISFFAFDEIAD